jgi:hypothetical protein
MLADRVSTAGRLGRLAGLGMLWMSLSVWASAAPLVKSVAVDARAMKFPSISLDGISYESLQFEYAARGKVAFTTVNAAMETLQCAGKPHQNHYLAVDYRGPEVIFRIKDQRKNRVLLLQKQPTDGTYLYGQGVCNGNAGLKERLEKEKPALLAALNDQVMAAARAEMQTYIANNTVLDYEDLNFPLFYFSASGSRYDSMNRAFDRAREAFGLSMEFGITKEADDILKLVAATWERELNAITGSKSPTADDEVVSLALHRNLTQVHFFLRRYDQARRHDALALAKGMPAGESRQALILEHERRTILSPQVAANIVLTANLYRFGKNVIREARLVEVDNFSELEQALAQR